MKIIQQKAVAEISKIVCDVCKKEAVSSFKFDFGYGSRRDMGEIKGDFCEECGEKFAKYILKKYKGIKYVNNFIDSNIRNWY